MQDPSGANNAAGAAHGLADVTIGIIADAPTLATDAVAAHASGNASEQATKSRRAGALAKVMAAHAPASRRRKRPIADCSSDSEVQRPHLIYLLSSNIVLVLN